MRAGRQAHVYALLRMTAISPSTSRIPLSSPSLQSTNPNPISLRLYKVLGASFDDDATREALDTLAELYAHPASHTHTSSGKGKDVRADGEGEGEVDDEYETGAGGTVVRPRGLVAGAGAGAGVEESVAGDIAARARKNLRRDVENKLAESSRQFLKAFGEVDKVRSLFRTRPYIRLYDMVMLIPNRCMYGGG